MENVKTKLAACMHAINTVVGNYYADSAGYGCPVPHFEGFDKSMGKHHRGYSLCWSQPHFSNRLFEETRRLLRWFDTDRNCRICSRSIDCLVCMEVA